MIIISNKYGFLANRMLVFAHFMAFALENDISLYNPAFDEYSTFFTGSQKGLLIKNRKFYSFFDKTAYKKNIAFRISRKLSQYLPILPIPKKLSSTVMLKSDEFFFSLDDEKNIDLLKNSYFTWVSGWLFRGKKNSF